MLLFTLLPFWGRNGGNPATWAEQQLSDVASSTFTSPLNSQWTSLFSSPPHGLTLTHFSFRIYWSVFPPAAAMNKSQERDREAVVAGRQRRTEREEEEEDEEEALCWLSAGPFEPVSEHLVAITAAVSVGWSNEKTYFCHIMAALLCGFSPQSVCLKEKTGPSGSSSWIQVVVYLKQCGVVWSVCGTLWGKHFPVTTIIPKAKLIERCFFSGFGRKRIDRPAQDQNSTTANAVNINWNTNCVSGFFIHPLFPNTFSCINGQRVCRGVAGSQCVSRLHISSFSCHLNTAAFNKFWECRKLWCQVAYNNRYVLNVKWAKTNRFKQKK